MSDNGCENARNEASLYSNLPPPLAPHNSQYQVPMYPQNVQSSQERSHNPDAGAHCTPSNSPAYLHYPHIYSPTEYMVNSRSSQFFNANPHPSASFSTPDTNSRNSQSTVPHHEQQKLPPVQFSQSEGQLPEVGGIDAVEHAALESLTTWQLQREHVEEPLGYGPRDLTHRSENITTMHSSGLTGASDSNFPFPPTGAVFKRHTLGHSTKQLLPSRESQQIEFVKGSPLYTKQLILLFGASFFGMIPFLSHFSMATLLCCVVVTYILDYLGFTRSTIAALLATALLFSVALFLSNLHTVSTSIGPIFMILDFGALLMLATATAALHFRYLQDHYPELICSMDRLVMGLTPVLALPFLLASIIALGGSRRAPLLLLVVMCAESYYFYRPIHSSFTCVRQLVVETDKVSALRTGKHGRDKGKASGNNADAKESANKFIAERTDLMPIQLNERSESIIFTFLLLTLPIAVYTTLQSNFFDDLIPNLFNCLGLLCSGAGYLCAFPNDTFWFLAPEKIANEEDNYHRLAYDPYGLEALIRVHRFKIVVIVCISVINWVAYRLVRCRYKYLFDGIPYPYNFVVLLLALHILLYAIIQVKLLLDADVTGDSTRLKHPVRKRISTVVSVMIVTILVCLLMGAPGIFYLLGVLSIFGFHMFLLDRSAGAPIVYFIVFSSFLLLWWMYRTFSFVVLDLHVLGSSVIVSTSAVAVAVLFCYILGWIGFAFSFQKSNFLVTIFLSLHAAELSFVEEVLYSQKEEGSYPAVLVGLTSGVGILMAWRLFKNEVLTVAPAAFLASFYVAKAFVFLVEVTGSYYQADMECNPYVSTISMIEINGGWWVALLASYIVAIFEIEGRRCARVRNAKLLIYGYLVASGLLSLLTIRNIQRAVYEFITRSYISADELSHIALGTGLLTFCLLTLCFLSRHKTRYSFIIHLVSLMRFGGIVGILMLLVQPTRITNHRNLSPEYELYCADRGRYATMLGIFLLFFGCYIPLQRLPEVLRGLYWAGASLALAFGITTTLLPISTVPLFCTVSVVVFFDLVVLDFAHYRRLQSIDIWIFYGLSVCGIVASFFALRRVKLLQAVGGDESLALMMHEEGRTRFLSIMAVINLFLVILLRARLNGRPLLPGCTPLKPFIVNQVSVLCNGAVLFTVSILYLLNFLCRNGEPSFYASCSLLLILLVDDRNNINKIQKAYFSYFLMISSTLAVLWLSFLSEGWGTGRGFTVVIKLITSNLAFSLPLLLSQVSLLTRLWHHQRACHARFKNPQIGFGIVLVIVIINTLVLFLISCKKVQWMCIVTICGEAALVIGNRLMQFYV